jgi:hypothetical protein
MNKVWVGYEDIAFTPASTTSGEKFTELLTDNSGVPILHGVGRLYVKPGKSAALREVVQEEMCVGPLVVCREKPTGRGKVRRQQFSKGESRWVEEEEEFSLMV